MAPSYIILRTSWRSPHVILADLESLYISLVHFSAAYVICSLNLNLVSMIIPLQQQRKNGSFVYHLEDFMAKSPRYFG